MANRKMLKEMGDMVIMLRQLKDDERAELEAKIAQGAHREAPEARLKQLLATPHVLVDGHLRPAASLQ